MNLEKSPPDDRLRKPSECIHTNHDLSQGAMLSYNLLLANALPDIADRSILEFSMPLQTLKKYLGTRNEDAIKGYLRELHNTSVEFNNLNKHGIEWGIFSYLSDPYINDGVIYYTNSWKLRELISESKSFAVIYMLREKRFNKTKYAIPLYELCLDYRGNVDKMLQEAFTPWMEIEQFKRYMGVKPGENESFKVFNRDVIKKAVKKINDSTEIFITALFQKHKCEVKNIRFKIEPNHINMSPREIVDLAAKHLGQLTGSQENERDHYIKVMHEVYGISLPTAKKWSRKFIGQGSAFELAARKVTERIESKTLPPIENITPYAFTVFSTDIDHILMPGWVNKKEPVQTKLPIE